MSESSTGTLAPARERHEEISEPIRVLIPSPIGNLGIEFRGTTVTRLRIQPSRGERRMFKSLKEIPRSEFLDEALGRLSEYFAGARQDLELKYDLGPSELPDFAHRILREAARIPYGSHRSYQQVAIAVGQPEAYRLVRSTLMSNPIPIVIPCHRVVPSKGGGGSYIAGEKKKEWLLRLESQEIQGVDRP